MTDQDQNQGPMQVAVHAQYIRDFSFESPNAPQIFGLAQQKPPAIEMGVNVQTRTIEPNTYEVMLLIKMEAKIETTTAFIAELAYGGVFSVPVLPEDHLKVFLLVEAPRLLFPFARQIIANAVREGGFPQVLINPIDFGALYQQQQGQMDGQAAGNA